MNRLLTLSKAYNFQIEQSKKLRKMSWTQKQDYFDFDSRIYRLYLLLFYLSLRGKIKEQVQGNEEIKIVEYDGYDTVDFQGQILHKQDLQPLIDGYIKYQTDLINNHTLKLDL